MHQQIYMEQHYITQPNHTATYLGNWCQLHYTTSPFNIKIICTTNKSIAREILKKKCMNLTNSYRSVPYLILQNITDIKAHKKSQEGNQINLHQQKNWRSKIMDSTCICNYLYLASCPYLFPLLDCDCDNNPASKVQSKVKHINYN